MSLFKNSLFAIASGIILLAQTSGALAIVSPQVYFTTGPVMEKNSFSSGAKVSGTVELWNYEDSAMSDLVFNFQLLAGEKDGVPTELVDNSQKGEAFSLAAGAKEVKDFEYLLPANIDSGNYTFRIQLTNARGEKMAWTDKVISVGGNGKFLTIDNGAIIKDGKSLSTAAGVYYQAGDVVTIKFDVANDSGFTITAAPSIITYNRNVGSDVVNKKNENNIVINSGEKKTLTYELAKTNIPDTYLSEVKLLDPASGEAVSNAMLFRWIISGEGARTLYVSSDKAAYSAGDEAKINVKYNGSADHTVDAGVGTLGVELSDPQGNVIGSSSQQVELKPGSVTIGVPVEKDSDKFKIAVTLSKGSKGYDHYEVNVVPKGEQWEEEAASTTVPQKKDDGIEGKIIIGISILIILVILMYSYFKKNKSGVVGVCFAIAFLAGISGAGSALALIEVTDGCDATQITPALPVPGTEVYPGGTVTFRDSIQVASCGNGLFFNKANFYITEDGNIPVVDALGRSDDVCDGGSCTTADCLSCFGANSSTYGCAAYTYGDQVKRLDNSSGYKIYKLGTANVFDVGGHEASDWPHVVEFNKTFNVPANINIYGPVRFYIEYVGTHWNGNWNWNVSYETGYIRAVPTAGNLKAAQPDYCTMNPTASFKWSFESDDSSASQASYRIQISKTTSFSSLVYDSQEINSASKAFSIPVGILDYNKTYYWRLKVVDSYSTESEWVSGDPVVTPTQAAPHPVITYTPKTPIVLQRMNFSSASSYCYSGPTKIACSDDPNVTYSWNFGNGKTSALANDTAVFPDKNNYSVNLRISSGGLSCSDTKVMIVNDSLPTWQEVGD